MRDNSIPHSILRYLIIRGKMELKYIPMEQKEQTLLAVRIATNKHENQNDNLIKLINSLYGYIKQQSYRYASRAKSDNDSIQKELEQEAILGIYKAIEKYDTKKCPEFFPYAKQWIDAYIRAEYIKRKSMCKIQTKAARVFLTKMPSISDKPIEEQIKILNISRTEYDDISRAIKSRKGLYRARNDDRWTSAGGASNTGGAPEETEEYIASNTPTPEQALTTKLLIEKISQIKQLFTEELDQKQKDIFENLVSGEDSSFNITQKYGITRQRVQQIRESLKEKFRKRLEFNGINRNAVNSL